MNEELSWLKDLKSKTKSFLDLLANKDYSYFKYSLSGDIYSEKDDWGLGQSVFAAKILHITDYLDDMDIKKKENLISSIKRFQDKDGYISDPLIIRLQPRNRSLFTRSKIGGQQVENIKRAETRQSFAALSCLGDRPEKPFLYIPYETKEIQNYLSSFDWRFPWHAGSHFSHLIFFYRFNDRMFGYKSDRVGELIDCANDWIDGIQSKKDGFWYTGDTTLTEKINGAMKILTGKQAAGIYDIDNHEMLIDNCLEAVNDSEACSNFNIVYVLYCCSKISDYRKEDIKKFCIDRLKKYKNYYFEKIGGFSFYRNKANDMYYGARITRALDEPDVHGTIMFIWGISLISFIEDFADLDLKILPD